MMKIWHTGLLAGFLLLLAGCSELEWHSTDITGVMPDLEFTLTDEAGESVTAEQYNDKASLVFFGFTHCPDICPLTLASLASHLRQFSDEEREQVQVLFVSVDPDRDTPDHLREYTNAFGPEFVGLTGTQEQLRDVTRRYRVTYSYAEPDEHGAYDVSHSSGIFGFNSDGEAVILMRDNLPPEQQLEDIRQLITS